jgi:hypothetical protein
MENIANLGCLFAVHKLISEYVERIYAYMEKTQRDTKLGISLLIMVPHEFFLEPLLSIQDGLAEAQKFHATVPLICIFYLI